jgi:hydroxypyruvate reductase
LDRPAQDQLSPRLGRLRADASAVLAAAVAAVSPRTLVPRALSGVARDLMDRPGALDVVAVGKAAAAMHAAFVTAAPGRLGTSLTIGPHRPVDWTGGRWVTGGHPFATDGSLEGGRAALAIAAAVAPGDRLLVLLSGGASALMAAPAAGLSLAAKQHTARTMMAAGAAITELNAVRKHLSAVKGGRLAAACRGQVVTLAISDVVGDDLSVIGSGPAVPDASTWQDVFDALHAFGGAAHDPGVLAVADAGCAGTISETPKAGDPAMAAARGYVIGGRREAMTGAAEAARGLGYDVVVDEAAVVGEARDAAERWWHAVAAPAAATGRRLAVITSGETTVRVTGRGRGGRNQEFALAAAAALATLAVPTVLASLGTDGIDGPTDAAGALADPTTIDRARQADLDPVAALAGNDSYPFFAALGDLLRPGPTDTNVGDLQVLLVSPA